MGYDTYYTLKIYPDRYPRQDVLDTIESVVGGYNPIDSTCSWYDHEDHMIEVSKQHRSALLVLQGAGENSLDVWRKAYLNGRMEWDWRLDGTIPEPPTQLIEQATKMTREYLKIKNQERIKKLKAELAELEGEVND